MQSDKDPVGAHVENPLQPFREYSVAALSRITGVHKSVLTKAIERSELAAIDGPGGRGGRWRVLGQSYLDWQKKRHGRSAQRPVYRDEAVADAEARFRAALRNPGRTVKEMALGGVAQPRGGAAPQVGEETAPK